jgi:photosystem II stability/assembly factor-like uncharacterized protein
MMSAAAIDNRTNRCNVIEADSSPRSYAQDATQPTMAGQDIKQAAKETKKAERDPVILPGDMRLVRPFALLTSAALLSVHLLGAESATPLDPTLVSALRWRSIGPAATGGRVDDFAVARVPGAPDAIYVATASGGVFKSTNQGTSWTPIFDGVEAMMSIGDVAVAPSNTSVVWVGTGEANNRQSSSWGDGVYKSTDGGKTWTAVGLKDTRHIGRIVVHPTNPDVVYVAAQGHLWGSNAERGVFKTSDGGKTWTRSLFVDENTGATDVIMDAQNPEVLFAATYQRQRKAWGFNGGGPGSAIYRTDDGGVTWTKLTNGLPRGDKGRIGLDLFRGDGRIVYAAIEAVGRENGIYRSVNRGDTWEQISNVNPRPMYFSQIRLDPKDRNRVYLLGSNRGFYVSDDGGKDFRDVFSTVHSEDHALWIDPDDTNHLIVGGDGGVSISWDRGVTWEFRDNLPIGQFYEISADMADPYTICGGLQDNGLWCVPSATRLRTGISNRDTFNVGSGDGFYARIDPTDPQTVVVESQEGRANRVNLATLERQAIAPLAPDRLPPGVRERWNWNTPIAMSAFDPKVLYMGSNVVFRSPDRGVTWKAISPDLTANVNRDTLTMMGAPVPDSALSRHDGTTSFSTLTTISESPLDAKLLYTGSDDGQINVTRDGGKTWANVSAHVGGQPAAGAIVSSVLASRHAIGRVYATFDAHASDDYGAYVFVSDDYGQTWRPIARGLPQASVHKLREHPRNARLLFAGHERGLSVSIDAGQSWSSLNLNMPPVPVDDILVHPRDNDLIVGTHGRSLWILDNVGALEALTPETIATDALLVAPARAHILTIYNPQAWYGAGQFFAPNPQTGATIDYYLRDGAPAATLAIADASGAPVRTLKVPGRRGVNRAVWDMRIEPPVPEMARAAGGGFGGPLLGPAVMPGTYTVTLTLPGGATQSKKLEVLLDPRLHVSDADRRSRQTALLKLYEIEKTIAAARSTGRQEDTTVARVQSELTTTLNAAASLTRAIDGYSGAPTVDQRRQIEWVSADLAKALAQLTRATKN